MIDGCRIVIPKIDVVIDTADVKRCGAGGSAPALICEPSD